MRIAILVETLHFCFHFVLLISAGSMDTKRVCVCVRPRLGHAVLRRVQ